MTPEFAREGLLMRGAIAKGTPGAPQPYVYLSASFASITPDTAAGGGLMVGGFEIARSGDTSAPVTVGIALTGRLPTPLVAGDVQGGLSDVPYTIPAGESRLPLSISFPAQDLYDNDHYGRVQLHDASVAIAGNGRFDFVLFHNKTTIINPPAYALVPDWTQKWVQHTTALGLVMQLAAGVELDAGTLITDDNATLVSKDIHTAGDLPAPSAAAPLKGWEVAPALLASGDPNRQDIRTLADVKKYLGGVGGPPPAADKQYVIVNSINGLGTTVSIGGGGTAGHMAWVRGVTEGRSRTAYPVLSGFQFNTNCVHTGFRCLTFDGYKNTSTNYLFELLTGTGFCQWESNWYKNQWQNGYDAGLHHVDIDQHVSDLLFAFNDYRADTGKIGCPFFRVDSADKTIVQQIARIRIAFNHTHGFKTGPNITVAGGIVGRTKWLFFGDGPKQQGYTNLAEVDHNLCTGWDSIGAFTEDKYPGIWYHDNTFEHGTRDDNGGIKPGADSPLMIKHRFGRTTVDGSTSIDAATPSSLVERNLWVWRPGYAFPTQHNIRDGYSLWRNNWGVTLANGQQPSAWGVQAVGPMELDFVSGNAAWETGGKGDQTCCGKSQAGATYGTVQVGTGGNLFDPNACRVAATTPTTRKDRNLHLLIVADRASSPTDTSTTVPGADVSIVPHRMQAIENGFLGTPEVGSAGWNAAAYGGGGGGSGDLDVSFDYTCTASPASTAGAGCASLFYCHMVGQGTYPADLSAWNATQWGAAGDVEYQPNANWFRYTFNTLNTSTGNTQLSNKARLVVCSGGVLTRPTPNEAVADFFFPVGTTYRLRCRKQSNLFTFTQSTSAGVLLATQTWTDATAGAMNTGNLLWRFQPARHAKIENLTVA